MANLKERAQELQERARKLRKAGAMAQMSQGPALVEDTGDFLVEMAERLDALTPYQDEGGAE